MDILSSGGGPSIGGTVTGGTTGSVLFIGAAAVLAEDNSNFFWDDTNNRLGIGTTTPGTNHSISANEKAVDIKGTGVAADSHGVLALTGTSTAGGGNDQQGRITFANVSYGNPLQTEIIQQTNTLTGAYLRLRASLSGAVAPTDWLNITQANGAATIDSQRSGGLVFSQGGTAVAQVSTAGAPQFNVTGHIYQYLGNTYKFGTDSFNLYPPVQSFFGTGGVMIGKGSGAISSPNYHLDQRQVTAATQIYSQWSITTTTGHATTDGLLVGLHSDGTARINQQENLSLELYTNGTAAFEITNAQVLKNRVAGNESTAAGAALLGANCPAATVGNPYTWLKVLTSDGSTGYIPIWK